MCNFLVSSWSSRKIGTNYQQKRFNYSQNIFVLSKNVLIWCILWGAFYGEKESFLNMTPKLDTLKKIFFCADIKAIMATKKDEFYIYIL